MNKPIQPTLPAMPGPYAKPYATALADRNVLFSPQLTPMEKCVWLAFSTYAWHGRDVVVSKVTIAAGMGVHKVTVYQALARCAELGFIGRPRKSACEAGIKVAHGARHNQVLQLEAFPAAAPPLEQRRSSRSSPYASRRLVSRQWAAIAGVTSTTKVADPQPSSKVADPQRSKVADPQPELRSGELNSPPYPPHGPKDEEERGALRSSEGAPDSSKREVDAMLLTELYRAAAAELAGAWPEVDAAQREQCLRVYGSGTRQDGRCFDVVLLERGAAAFMKWASDRLAIERARQLKRGALYDVGKFEMPATPEDKKRTAAKRAQLEREDKARADVAAREMNSLVPAEAFGADDDKAPDMSLLMKAVKEVRGAA